MKKVLATVLCAAMMVSMVACGGKTTTEEGSNENANTSKELVVYCPHPLEFIDPLVQEFENETGIDVEVIAAGTGELLKRIESEVENPQGDVMWGGSLGTLQPVAENLFEPYKSVNEDDILDDSKNVEGTITRFSNIPSVIMINTDLIGDIEINGYEDLLNPDLKGKIAHADPSKSSSSFEHLVNMLYAMGKGDPEAGWDYADKLAEALDGKLLSGSSAVYKGVADGEYTVGLTFEEGGAKYVADGSPVKLVYMEEGVISKPDAIGIIKGAKNMDNAKLFLDFVTGEKAQTMVATQLNRRSVRKDVGPAEGLLAYEDINLIQDDADVVAANKETWIEKFRDIFTDKQ